MVGTAKYLKKLFPDLKVVDVDTPNSVLFGQKMVKENCED